MKFTLFDSHLSKVGQLHDTSWSEFTHALIDKPIIAKCTVETCPGHKCPEKEVACWSPSEFKENQRRDTAVVAVHALVYDVDDVSGETLDAISETLRKIGVGAIIVGTHAFTDDNPRVRVVIRLSRPLLSSEFTTVWTSTATTLNIPFDNNAKNIGRIYYLPSTPRGRDLAYEVIDGDGLDVDAIVAKQKGEKLPSREVPAFTSSLAELQTSLKKYSAELYETVTAGEGFTEGGRDNSINQLASRLVFALPHNTPAAAIYELMRPILNKTPQHGSEDWHAKANSCIARAMERRDADVALKRAEHDVNMQLLREASAAADTTELDAENIQPYTAEQLATWAAEQHCPSVEAFARRWIIHKGSVYYIFVNGKYKAAVGRDDLQNTFQRDLSRAPVMTVKQLKNGQFQPLKASEILNLHGTVARHLEASLTHQNSFYDAASETFFEAACPKRPLQPEFNKQIQGWLELLGSDVVSWVASVARLDKQCGALYIDGPPETGKTLLPTGLARIWTRGGATPMDSIVHGFNDRLKKCPLVHADETLPDIPNKSTFVRQFVGNTQHNLREMFKPAMNLSGCPRLLITANNSSLFNTNEELTLEDLNAYAERIIYVKIGDAPKKYLRDLIEIEKVDLNSWIEDDLLARHALWLQANHTFKPGKRYLVEGKLSEFHQHLATNSGITSHIVEWVSRYIASNCDKLSTMPSAFVVWGQGKVLVASDAFTSSYNWNHYMPSARQPSLSRIARALHQLAEGQELIDGKPFYRLNTEIVKYILKQLAFGKPDEAIASIESSEMHRYVGN